MSGKPADKITEGVVFLMKMMNEVTSTLSEKRFIETVP